MRIRHRSRLKLSTQQLFCLEQWVAFLLGSVCLGMSLWSGFQDPGVHPFSGHFGLIDGVNLVFWHWLLVVAVALIGVSLLRFALHKARADEASIEGSFSESLGSETAQRRSSTVLRLGADSKGKG